MSESYIGEIRMFGGNFAPSGWALCNGQLLPIADYSTLFTLIGTTYGGDGQTTFALPDLRGRVPLHQGTGLQSYTLGQTAGVETVTLTSSQIASHSHPPQADNTGAGTPGSSPSGNYWGTAAAKQFLAPPGTLQTMSAAAMKAFGGGQAHENRVPYLGINFIISLFGIFPSQN